MYKWLYFCCLIAAVLRCSAATANDLAKARLEDLDVVQRDYVERSPAFAPQAREKARDLIASLRKESASLTEAQFAFAIAKIAAFADNAHDSVHFMEGSWAPTLRLPFRMIWFPDALLIARSSAGMTQLLGASVLSIDGFTPAQIMERLRPLQGGTDEYRRWSLSWILQSPEALHALGIAKEPSQVVMRLRLKNARVIQRTVRALPAEEIPAGQHPARYWIPAPWSEELTLGWKAAADVEEAPLYLQQPEEWFRLVPLPEVDAFYLQFRSNFDMGEAKIAPFVASVSDRIKTAPPKNIIVDLRFDTGGDNTQNRDLMKQIAQSINGRIYLLVGNYTFSAGIASAAALKHDGGDKVIIIGSEIADRMRWWSEGSKSICLPNSKICMDINTGVWDLVNGCKSEPACYGDQFDLNVPSLKPMLEKPLTSQDWLNNRDPAMNAILRELRLQKQYDD